MRECIRTGHEINRALMHFIEIHPDTPVTVVENAFWMWLGINWGMAHLRIDNDLFKLPEPAARYIDMLNSPHYHALYKAYQIRQQGD